MVEAKIPHDKDDISSQNGSCPSEYSGSYSDADDYDFGGEKIDNRNRILYIGSLPRTEDQINEELREQFCQELENFREEKRKKALADRITQNQNAQQIFGEMTEFTAGSIKQMDDGSQKYVPLFPYFYCNEVQQGFPNSS